MIRFSKRGRAKQPAKDEHHTIGAGYPLVMPLFCEVPPAGELHGQFD
jgi:hypothetical protein